MEEWARHGNGSGECHTCFNPVVLLITPVCLWTRDAARTRLPGSSWTMRGASMSNKSDAAKTYVGEASTRWRCPGTGVAIQSRFPNLESMNISSCLRGFIPYDRLLDWFGCSSPEVPSFECNAGVRRPDRVIGGPSPRSCGDFVFQAPSERSCLLAKRDVIRKLYIRYANALLSLR